MAVLTVGAVLVGAGYGLMAYSTMQEKKKDRDKAFSTGALVVLTGLIIVGVKGVMM